MENKLDRYIGTKCSYCDTGILRKDRCGGLYCDSCGFDMGAPIKDRFEEWIKKEIEINKTLNLIFKNETSNYYSPLDWMRITSIEQTSKILITIYDKYKELK